MQPKFYVNVDSISSQGAGAKKTFVLLPGNKDTSVEDLQFREFASYVRRALTSKGFVPADGIEKADIAIFLAYGIGDPKEHLYSYSLPVFGQTGVSSATTFGTLSTYGGFGTYSATTTFTPTYGITGYTSHVGSYTTYFRYMLLDAYDLNQYRKEKKLKELWRTTVTSTGSSSDLRRVFPILVAGSKPYIGSNTENKIEVVLDENDSEVLAIKGVSSEQSKTKE